MERRPARRPIRPHPEFVAWSTRRMPWTLRERLRAEAALLNMTQEELATAALSIGLRELERRRVAEQAAEAATLAQIEQEAER